jgi:hypothetical protein
VGPTAPPRHLGVEQEAFDPIRLRDLGVLTQEDQDLARGPERREIRLPGRVEGTGGLLDQDLQRRVGRAVAECAECPPAAIARRDRDADRRPLPARDRAKPDPVRNRLVGHGLGGDAEPVEVLIDRPNLEPADAALLIGAQGDAARNRAPW